MKLPARWTRALTALIAAALLGIGGVLPAQSPPVPLDTLDGRLKTARLYRLGYPGEKTRNALRDAWRGQNLFAEFVTIRREAQRWLTDSTLEATLEERADALRLVREAVNEVLSGQLQMGNEQLLNAGRRKFPSVLSPTTVAMLRTPYDERDEWKELAIAALEFDMGVLEALDAVRAIDDSELPIGERAVLRSRGGNETINTPAEGFPTYTVFRQAEFEPVGQNSNNFIRTDANHLMGILSRRGLAATATVDRMRRLSYRANNDVEGSQRHGEQGERRKEELNRLAMDRAKRDAQLMFYGGLLLRSELPATAGDVARDDFKLHNGDKLFAAMNLLNVQFKDIRDGRPPTGIADQFVPSPNKRVGGQQGYLSDAITSVSRAKESQLIAEQRVREYQQAQVSQVELNRNIREQYLTQLGQLTGFLVDAQAGVLKDPLDDSRVFDLKSAESRKAFTQLFATRVEEADRAVHEGTLPSSHILASLGRVGSLLVEAREAQLAGELSRAKAEQIVLKAELIDEKLTESRAIATKYSISRHALNGMIKTYKLLTAQGQTSAGTSTNAATLPQRIAAGILKIAIDNRNAIIDSFERTDLQNLERDIQVKELMGGMKSVEVESDLATARQASVHVTIDQLLRQVTDLVENLNIYRSDTAVLWFLDPSLEVEKVDAEIQADLDLVDCLATLYDLTKSLEFYWTEKFQNPVLTVDGGIVTLPNFANDFTEIDDLYAITDAYDAEKYLNTLGFNLSAGSAAGWDSTLRALRQSIPAQNHTVVLSLRKDVMGFVVPERAYWDTTLQRPGDTLTQIHENGHILPGMEQAYAYYENEAITKFRDRLQNGRRDAWEFAFGTGRDPQDFLPGFEFTFSTNEKSSYYFDAREWNARLQSIQVDVRTEGGFIPPGQEENFVRLSLIQEGTVKFRRSFPLELSDAQFDVYQTEFRYQSDRLRISPYEFPVQSGVNGSSGQFGGQPAVLPYFFSPICSNWRVVLDPLAGLANNYADINKIKDIRLIMTVRSGIPPTLAEGL